jgi:hypothetical protein
MVPSNRRSVTSGFIFLTALVSLTAALPVAIRASAPDDPSRITAVANVTLRTSPSSTAAAVAQLPLGTEVTESGPSGLDKTWIHVKLPDAREGWLQSSLLRTLDPVWRWPVFDRIIAERLGRKGDGFMAQVELVSFIERVAPEYTDKDGRARIELSRLRALDNAAVAIPRNGQRRDPYVSWLASRQNDLVYDEPGGRWILRDKAIWDVHAKHASTESADDIAWFAVQTGLGGECEGWIECYLSVRNRVHGEYLRQHPGGRYAAEAVDVISKTIDTVAPSGAAAKSYSFDKKAGCGELVSAVDQLTVAVQATRTPGRDLALGKLVGMKKLCGPGE